jgi:ketosteroid isomerase-like protein
MKAGTIALGVISTLLVWGLGTSAYAASPKAEIMALEHKCITATTTAEAMACVDEKQIVLFDVVPPLRYAGADAVRADFDNFFGNAKDLKGEFVALDVTTDGRLGIAQSIQHFTWTGKDGKPMAATFRVTDCLHKAGGHWKIFHSHVSMPVDFATGKAVMDGKL